MKRHQHPRTIWIKNKRWTEVKPVPPAQEYKLIAKAKVTDGMEVIYLQPWCADCDESQAFRPWCEDNVWDGCELFDCNARTICYLKAAAAPE